MQKENLTDIFVIKIFVTFKIQKILLKIFWMLFFIIGKDTLISINKKFFYQTPCFIIPTAFY